jgi:hypothetical protein
MATQFADAPLHSRPRGIGLVDEAYRAFEPKFIEFGIGEDQVEAYALPRLRASLLRVDDAIARASEFGFVKFTPDGSAVLTMNRAEAHVAPHAFLQQRKQAIVDRIAALESAANVNELRTVVDRADPALRAELRAGIETIVTEASRWRAQSETLSAVQSEAQIAQQIEAGKLESLERRSRIWQSFLRRQSVATIIGAVLLILTFMFMVYAAVDKAVEVPEQLNSAFLVILGYFFGQGSKEKKGSSAEPR